MCKNLLPELTIVERAQDLTQTGSGPSFLFSYISFVFCNTFGVHVIVKEQTKLFKSKTIP